MRSFLFADDRVNNYVDFKDFHSNIRINECDYHSGISFTKHFIWQIMLIAFINTAVKVTLNQILKADQSCKLVNFIRIFLFDLIFSFNQQTVCWKREKKRRKNPSINKSTSRIIPPFKHFHLLPRKLFSFNTCFVIF